MGIRLNQYLKGMLGQVLDSYHTLGGFQDAPGDLENVRREMLRINGLLRVIAGKIDEYGDGMDSGRVAARTADLRRLASKFRHYLDGYYFEKEIQTISELYAEDGHRLKNMRLKIIEALEDKKMIRDIKDVMEEL